MTIDIAGIHPNVTVLGQAFSVGYCQEKTYVDE
jgi:hypothetical protein